MADTTGTSTTEYQVETWYDRHERAYVTYIVGLTGIQVGPAMYDGTKAARDASARYLQGLIDGGKVAEFENRL